MKTRYLGLICATFLFVGWRADYYVPEKVLRADRGVASAKGDEILPPHSELFKFTSAHGSLFIKNRALCKSCHGSDLAGGAMKSSCLKCHPVLESFPHFDGDISSSHAKAYLKNPLSCKGCHGGELQGSGSAVACKQCHNYPHSMRWSLPREHGEEFLKEFHGETKPVGPGCLDCHVKGSKTALSCGSCHREVPHPESEEKWGDYAGGHAKDAKTYEGKCVNCHRGYQANMPNYGSCDSCHTASDPSIKRWELTAKWKKPDQVGSQRSISSDRPDVQPMIIFWGSYE